MAYDGKAVVPDHDIARVMYYLRSVTLSCGVDLLRNDLVDYKNYARLPTFRADQVFDLAYRYSPDEFNGKTIFMVDDMPLRGGHDHDFLEVTDQLISLLDMKHLRSEVLIAGLPMKFEKILLFKRSWIETYYTEPMKRNVDRVMRAQVSQSNHCEHCAGREGRCVCESCPQKSESKCSRSLSSLLTALGTGSENSKFRHCDHCKGLDAPCGCESGCRRPKSSTCQIIHKDVSCNYCGEERISGARFECAECFAFNLCGNCYGQRKHGEHSFLQIDRPGCTPARRLPTNPRPSTPFPAKPAPKHVPDASSAPSTPRKGFFYLEMSPSELKAYLKDNGVSYDDCFEKEDLQRRVWECHADNMSGKELAAFMAETHIPAPDSECRSIAGRRECLKRAFKVAAKPQDPVAESNPGQASSFRSGQRVTLQGLRATDMNGKCGTVKDPTTSDPNRASVVVDGCEKAMLIKYVNLESASAEQFLD